MRNVLVAVGAAVICAGAAAAAGPWPGLADHLTTTSGIEYATKRAAGKTTITSSSGATATIAGAWGIPAVTTAGAAGGLSPDGKLLVLVPPPSYNGLRTRSDFLVLSATTLGVNAQVSLRGEFGFDALSPDGRWLYVIQHISTRDLVRYVVRAYDLRAHRLLPGVIVDKRSPNEAMRGYAVARATTATGAWVYTLYTKNPGSSLAFVHALNAAGRYAFCIDLTWTAGDIWDAQLELSGRTLYVRAGDGSTVARIDTRTLRVTS